MQSIPDSHLGICSLRQDEFELNLLGNGVAIPYWLLVVLVTPIAAVPWLRLRFSLHHANRDRASCRRAHLDLSRIEKIRRWPLFLYFSEQACRLFISVLSFAPKNVQAEERN